ncbi:hypothetical protein CR513_41369, partial [Mucuna pruriens]
MNQEDFITYPTIRLRCIFCICFLHNLLGHPSLAKLKLMIPSLNKLSILECESCQLGKHVRSTFPNQVNKRCNLPFSIVHSDIWGPSRVTSFGFNYFVIFIDEYS